MRTQSEWKELIEHYWEGPDAGLRAAAMCARQAVYGLGIYLRGLIEFTNHCRNNCYYCGIRAGNTAVKRYRLSKSDILEACDTGYRIGFRTFVLQGGEDPWFTDQKICEIIWSIKEKYQDCAVTLSIGEREKESYQAFFSAGADRFLLRHETADPCHYSRLHPPELTLAHRQKCLYTLREIGFQVGAGFMVGSPFQTPETLAQDMVFLEDLKPHMVGLGPFLPHRDTPFGSESPGSLGLTLTMLCLVRLALPKVLLPATTALATLAQNGREQGFQCGANVVMPNLSPPGVRKNYSLYDNKKCTGDEAAEAVEELRRQVEAAGYFLDFSRGDSKMHEM